jgi:hypothetical protein
MVAMTLKCNCCNQPANDESIENFKRIYIKPVKNFPTENHPDVDDRTIRPEHIDLCGSCYRVVTDAFITESDRQKGQVK